MASSLSLLLQHCCPWREGSLEGFDLELQPRSGPVLPCHRTLLLARCPSWRLEGPVVAVDEDWDVVCILLRWAYCAVTDAAALRGTDPVRLGRALRLAEQVGLRDAAVLRERLYGNWRRRSPGSLGKDLSQGYAQRAFGNLWFACGAGPEAPSELVYGGFKPLLLAASSYFGAMLSGKWAETAQQTVKVSWPAAELERLLRFLHGGPDFIRTAQDLEKALHCADFFGLPILLQHANQWIADHLDVKSAPQLWNFVESEPRLHLAQIQDAILPDDLFIDADDACFDFHLREFAAMAGEDRPEEDEEDRWVPLHDLSYTLMLRLLQSGCLDVSTEQLKSIVARYVGAKWGTSPQGKVHMRTLMPPAVLFNRDLRDQLLGHATAFIRDVL